MAGRKVFNALVKRIEEDGGEQEILGRIAKGESVKVIASDYGVSPDCIYMWVHGGKTSFNSPMTPREEMYEAARAISADVLVDDALELLDTEKPENALELELLKERVRFRKWLAARRSQAYQDKKGPAMKVDLGLNIGQMHLDALKSSGHMGEEPKVIPAQVIEEHEG